MSKINLAILRGGPSAEYDASLLAGQAVMDVVDESRYNILDIFIDKNAIWHFKGIEVQPYSILQKVDVAFNALHGDYGEDGQVQNILERSGVAFTGPMAFGATVSFHNFLSLQTVVQHKLNNLKIQGFQLFNSLDLMDEMLGQKVDEVFSKFPPPYLVKPVKPDRDFEVATASTKDELFNLLSKMLMVYDELLVEEYIYGTELIVSLVEHLRGEDLYITPAIEILNRGKKTVDLHNGFISATEDTVRMPAQISEKIKSQVPALSESIFKILEGRHYGQIMFSLARDKDLYFLGYNALPELLSNSLFSQSLEFLGVSFREFVEHVIQLALNGK